MFAYFIVFIVPSFSSSYLSTNSGTTFSTSLATTPISFDLSAFLEKKVVIKPNNSELIPTGLQVAIPEELEIQIRPRSGLAAKESIGVLNSPGTIDSDYRGELKIILFNHGKEDFIINNGDRIAQMVLVPIIKMEFEEVDSLPDTVRGQGGFGSTGKK